MGKRANLSAIWHPFQNLDTTVQNAVENWWNDLTGRIRTGTGPPISGVEAQPSDTKDKTSVDRADRAAGSATDSGIVSDAQKASTAVSAGDTTAVPKLESSFHGVLKNFGIAALVTGVICLARSLADNADVIKQAQVVEPLIRVGMAAIAEGNQVMSGQDVNMSELSKASQQFYNATNHTSWDSAQSIQAEEGKPLTGPKPSQTLTTINKGNPFSFLATGKLGGALGAVCGPIGQGLSIIVGFLGGPVTTVVGLITAPVLSGPINDLLSPLAHWLAGDAVNVVGASGASYGYNVDYGAQLAANDQAIAAGGRALQPTEVAQLQNNANSSVQQTFDSHNLAYRLFNPYDAHSLISRTMDNLSPSPNQNIATLASSFLKFGSTLASLPGKLFSTIVHAQTTTPYNYGFPVYGFSESEMNNPAVENPYTNASDVANMLSSPSSGCLNSDGSVNTSCPYIKNANTCFGVDITYSPDPENNNQPDWSVSGGNTTTEAYASNYPQRMCSSPDPNWLRLRFFIFDTETMESMGCYLGNSQSCSNVGF